MAEHAASPLPVLYSFRRCPYAMRARMALFVSRQTCQLREIVLRNKPASMLEASPKATVPVLVLQEGAVLEESLEIMTWALTRNDPDSWLGSDTAQLNEMHVLIDICDRDFKPHLDRYKYPDRYEEGTDSVYHRTQGLAFLATLNTRLERNSYLFGPRLCLADVAVFPFIRQFANTDRAWFDKLTLPALQSWLDSLLTSDLFDSIMQKYPAWKPEDEVTYFPTQPQGFL